MFSSRENHRTIFHSFLSSLRHFFSFESANQLESDTVPLNCETARVIHWKTTDNRLRKAFSNSLQTTIEQSIIMTNDWACTAREWEKKADWESSKKGKHHLTVKKVEGRRKFITSQRRRYFSDKKENLNAKINLSLNFYLIPRIT